MALLLAQTHIISFQQKKNLKIFPLVRLNGQTPAKVIECTSDLYFKLYH